MPGTQPYSSIQPVAPITTGTTAAQLGGAIGIPGRTVFLRAAKTNTAAIFIGDSTVLSTPAGNIGLDLQPGEGIFLDLKNTNLLWAVSAAAQTLYASVLK